MSELRKVRILTKGNIPVINRKGPILKIFDMDISIMRELRMRGISVEDLGPSDNSITTNTEVIESKIDNDELEKDLKTMRENENSNLSLAARRAAKTLDEEEVKITDSLKKSVEKKETTEIKPKLPEIVEFNPLEDSEIDKLKNQAATEADTDERFDNIIDKNEVVEKKDSTEFIRKNNKYRNR